MLFWSSLLSIGIAGGLFEAGLWGEEVWEAVVIDVLLPDVLLIEFGDDVDFEVVAKELLVLTGLESEIKLFDEANFFIESTNLS